MGGSGAQRPECPAMTGRIRLALLLAAPVALLATASCSSEHESAAIAPYGTDSTVAVAPTVAAGTAAPADVIAVQRLAMVGDSITQGAQPKLEEAFAGLGLRDVVINAEQGRRMTAANSITSGVEGVEDVLAEGAPPDLWVIALGTNDVANYQPPDYAAAINEVVAAIPAGAPILWIDCYLEGYPDLSKQFDTTLRQVLAAPGQLPGRRLGDGGRRGRRPARRHPSLRLRDRRVHPAGLDRRRRLDLVAPQACEWKAGHTRKAGDGRALVERAEAALVAPPPPDPVDGPQRRRHLLPRDAHGAVGRGVEQPGDHQPGVTQGRRPAQRAGEAFVLVGRERRQPHRQHELLLGPEVALDEAAHVAGGRQVGAQAGQRGVELDVLVLHRGRRDGGARLAGGQRREQHGVLGPVVVVEHRRQQVGPSSRPRQVAGVTQPLDVGGLGAQAEVHAHEPHDGSWQVDLEHAGDDAGVRLRRSWTAQ